MSTGRIDAYFVCGGRYHDFDFARAQILALLQNYPRVRVRVAEDYSDTAALAKADLLITYTCDVRPSEREQDALAKWVSSGKRWFALHGTNSILDIAADGSITTPRTFPRFMQLLGSQFLAHPPIMDFDVHVTDPSHPLTHGLETFRINDELYLGEMHGENHVLLHCHFNGKAQRGFSPREWLSDDPRPVMYIHPHGDGEVLYLTPGHCRGKYDMQPLVDEYFRIERGAWDSPVYHELLDRGVRWAARLGDTEEPRST